MRKLSPLPFVVALFALAPSPSHAQWSIGARAGCMFGLGDVDGSAALGDVAQSQFPQQVDVSYRIGSRLSLGGYFSYGIGFVSGDLKEDCDAVDADCSASGLRTGVQMNLSFLPRRQPGSRPSRYQECECDQSWSCDQSCACDQDCRGGRASSPRSNPVDPWLGVGLGYESLSLDLDGTDLTMRGVEWLVQAGIDFHPTPSFGIGPYAGFSVGRYTSIDSDVGDGEIGDKELHEWITAGVRGVFDF